jgi:hypothetical protein
MSISAIYSVFVLWLRNRFKVLQSFFQISPFILLWIELVSLRLGQRIPARITGMSDSDTMDVITCSIPSWKM